MQLKKFIWSLIQHSAKVRRPDGLQGRKEHQRITVKRKIREGASQRCHTQATRQREQPTCVYVFCSIEVRMFGKNEVLGALSGDHTDYLLIIPL